MGTLHLLGIVCVGKITTTHVVLPSRYFDLVSVDSIIPDTVYVIKHAMRNHLLRVMMLETDKDLPDSHVEGTPLGPDEAVRFVWDKTPRQSVHNGRMKERVLKELKANRKLYKHVPDKDFGKKTMDSVFDQAFVTLRQKFKAQRDDSTALAYKQREEVKAQRARRLSRRKVVCLQS